jgi:predicted HTH transcriptional regulator
LTFEELEALFSENGPTPPDEPLGKLTLRTSDGQYNFLAYLLADDNDVSVKIESYAGADRSEFLESTECGRRCLIAAAQKTLERLKAETELYSFSKLTARKWLKKERVNPTALNEAAINAIVHNDYDLGVPLIEVFADKIIVSSAGGLVEGMIFRDFLKSYRSRPRNPHLMKVFRDLNLAEGKGVGLSRIRRIYDLSIYSIEDNSVAAIFPLEKPVIISGDEEVKDVKTTLDYIKEDPNVTVAQLAERTGKSETTLLREIADYQVAGLLGMKSSRKRIRWLVKDPR